MLFRCLLWCGLLSCSGSERTNNNPGYVKHRASKVGLEYMVFCKMLTVTKQKPHRVNSCCCLSSQPIRRNENAKHVCVYVGVRLSRRDGSPCNVWFALFSYTLRYYLLDHRRVALNAATLFPQNIISGLLLERCISPTTGMFGFFFHSEREV